MEFKLSSPAFNNGAQIPSRYTCDGENINPHLVIHGAPLRAKSLALLAEDPDAPSGQFVHWVLWNVSPEMKEIREHAVPFGAEEGINSLGEVGYVGPCPPFGTHRYFFRLFALDAKLKLPPESTKEDLDREMEGHIIAITELMGTYMRTNEGPL